MSHHRQVPPRNRDAGLRQSASDRADLNAGSAPTPLWAVLLLSSICSLATGVFWNGLPFIAEHDYDYSQGQTLWLTFFVGLIYIGAAFRAGTLVRRIARVLSPRGTLAVILALQSVICLGPWFFEAAWMIWAVAGSMSLLSAFLWPIVESYVSAGRHGRDMRWAIGWWNVVWTLAVGVALILMAPLMGEEDRTARFAIVGVGALQLVAAAALIRFRQTPAAHDETISLANIGPEYGALLRSARVLLPASYLLIGAISPLMPYRLAELEVSAYWMTPLTATWMFARVGVVVLLWRWHGWHGRWGTLLLCGLTMGLGFVAMVIAPSVPVMFAGLAAFGVGQGITYFAALYYAMALGRAAVDAGGKHEGLIGVGYAAGPFACVVGLWLARSEVTGPGGTPLEESHAIIAVVGTVLLVAAAGALVPYINSRRARFAEGE